MFEMPEFEENFRYTIPNWYDMVQPKKKKRTLGSLQLFQVPIYKACKITYQNRPYSPSSPPPKIYTPFSIPPCFRGEGLGGRGAGIRCFERREQNRELQIRLIISL